MSTFSFPYLDVQVPTPPGGDYKPWLDEIGVPDLMSSVPGASALIAVVAKQAAAALGPALGISTAAAGPVGAVIAAGGAVFSVLAGLFSGGTDPIAVKPVAGFAADLMQTNPLKNSNTAVAAGKLTSGRLENRGLVLSRVKQEALDTLQLALDGYEDGGWSGIDDKIGRISSRRAIALFLASADYKWLLSSDVVQTARNRPERLKGFSKLMAYGTPRFQIRQVCLYQRLAVPALDLLKYFGGEWNANAVYAVKAVAAAGGRLAFEDAAKRLALPIPTNRRGGHLWTFNTIRPEVVDSEMAYYREHKLEESVGGHFFSFGDISYSHIYSAIVSAKADSGHMSRVEAGLENMEASRKGRPLKTGSGTAAMQRREQERRDEKARAASSTSKGPLIAAGVAAAGLAGLWAWKKYGR